MTKPLNTLTGLQLLSRLCGPTEVIDELASRLDHYERLLFEFCYPNFIKLYDDYERDHFALHFEEAFPL